jgi:hypothetical protein
MAIGQAAAMIAKASLDGNVPVSGVNTAEVQRLLEKAGCRLRD